MRTCHRSLVVLAYSLSIAGLTRVVPLDSGIATGSKYLGHGLGLLKKNHIVPPESY